MKKYLPSILILVTLVGALSPMVEVVAQNQTGCIVTDASGNRSISQQYTTQAQCSATYGSWGNGCIVTDASGNRSLEVTTQAQCSTPHGSWGNGCIVTDASGNRNLQTISQTQCTSAHGSWGSGCIVTDANGNRSLQTMTQAQCTSTHGTWGNGCIVTDTNGNRSLEVTTQAQCSAPYGSWGSGCIVTDVSGNRSLEVTSQTECNKTRGTWGNGCIVTDANGNRSLEVISQTQCTAKHGTWVAQSSGNTTPTVSGTGYQLLAPLPNPDNPNQKTTHIDPASGLGSYLNLMIKIFIGLCAVLSVVMIVVGGLEYMTSELSHTKTAGKEKITQAILGLLLALGAYALLYTINPDLLKSDINIPNATTNGENCSDHELTTKALCESAGATWTP